MQGDLVKARQMSVERGGLRDGFGRRRLLRSQYVCLIAS
jgi:hypothetical protein